LKQASNNQNPTLEEIEKLVTTDKYYIAEYKELNRWGEISSVHVQALEIKESDSPTKQKRSKAKSTPTSTTWCLAKSIKSLPKK